MFLTRPSHVALLVKSVEHSGEFLRNLGFAVGPSEDWEGEGTKEIYVGGEKGNSLLLMEPAKPGAYRHAMEKRGPGLHHLAIDVLNLEEFLLSLGGSGWLLHPSSIKTMAQSKTAYLARPGFPALIEVQEREEFASSELFVSRIEIPFDPIHARLISAIGLGEIVFSSPKALIVLDSQAIPLDSILNPSL